MRRDRRLVVDEGSGERSRSSAVSRIDQEGSGDDWLADQGELDWAYDLREGDSVVEHSELAPGRPSVADAGQVSGPPAHLAAIRRRRIIALCIGLALVVAVVIVIVAIGGGSSPAVAPTVAATTPAAVTPTTTLTPTTGQATKPPASRLRVTLPSAGNLSRGESSAGVVALQKALTTLGYDAGAPDGKFGSATEAAVIKFQTQKGMTPDGIVGAKTAQALNQALASRNS